MVTVSHVRLWLGSYSKHKKHQILFVLCYPITKLLTDYRVICCLFGNKINDHFMFGFLSLWAWAKSNLIAVVNASCNKSFNANLSVSLSTSKVSLYPSPPPHTHTQTQTRKKYKLHEICVLYYLVFLCLLSNNFFEKANHLGWESRNSLRQHLFGK